MTTPVPLSLMARRLAPFVRAGLLDLDEAGDTVMESAIARGQCDGTPQEMPWDRAMALEEWARSVLVRESAKPAAPSFSGAAAHAQQGCDAAREWDRGLQTAIEAQDAGEQW
jgi:hypothetical protein